MKLLVTGSQKMVKACSDLSGASMKIHGVGSRGCTSIASLTNLVNKALLLLLFASVFALSFLFKGLLLGL